MVDATRPAKKRRTTKKPKSRPQQLPTPPTSPLSSPGRQPSSPHRQQPSSPSPPPNTPPHQLSKIAINKTPRPPAKWIKLQRKERKRLLLEQRVALATTGDSPLSLLCFPHILDSILLSCNRRTLIALRLTCREVKYEIDVLLSRHAKVRMSLPDLPRRKLPPVPPPMIGRSITGRSVTRRVSVLDVDPHCAKMYYLHFAPAWSESQHERNLWNSPFRPGPWLKPWLQFSTYWFQCQPRLLRFPGGVGVDEYFQSYQAQKAAECVVHFGHWDELEAGLQRLDSYYAAGGKEFDAVFSVDLAYAYRKRLPGWHDIRALDLKFVRRVTVHFRSTCDHWPFDRERRFQSFGVVLIALLELFVACAVRGSKCTIVGYDTWDQYMLPWHQIEGRTHERWRDLTRSMRRRLNAVIRQLRREVPGAWSIQRPVTLLKTKEWRRRIGEDYYQLLTDPNARYMSRRELPSYSSLMEG